MDAKKICITSALFLIILLSVMGFSLNHVDTPRTEYLRIHIRADSNAPNAQEVKFRVKDAVVEYLTPFVADCDTEKKAEQMLFERLPEIVKVANAVLRENGFAYTAKASVTTEEFPTRNYGDLTLEKGFYRALIIELGSGKGDNWWCVVYPPLCFTGEGGYVYRSKILEIIRKFRGKNQI